MDVVSEEIKKHYGKLTVENENLITPRRITASKLKRGEGKKANGGKHKEKNSEYIGVSFRSAVKLWK